MNERATRCHSHISVSFRQRLERVNWTLRRYQRNGNAIAQVDLILKRFDQRIMITSSLLVTSTETVRSDFLMQDGAVFANTFWSSYVGFSQAGPLHSQVQRTAASV